MASLLKSQSSSVGSLPERIPSPLKFFLFGSAPPRSFCREYHCFPIAGSVHRLPLAGSFDRHRGRRASSSVIPADASNRLIAAVVSDGTAAEPQLRGTEVPLIVEPAFSTTRVDADEFSTAKAEEDRLPAASRASYKRHPKANLPPRMCTLRAFGKSGEGVVASEPDAAMPSFCKSLASNVEFSAEIQDWEILSGRLAMMVFASAVLLEALTGNNVFEKLDSQKLLEFCAALVVSVLGSAGFALASQAKTRVTYTMSKGYEKLINGLIDNVIDGLLFDEEP